MDWKWLDWSEESVQNWATIRNMCNVFAAKSVYFTRAVSVLRQNHPVRAEHHLADTNHRISVYTEKMTSFDRDRRETRARAPRHSAAGSLFWLPFEGHFDFDFIVFFTDHLFETVDQPWRSNTRSNEILLLTHSLTDTIHDTCSDVIAQNFTTSTDRWTCGRLRIYEKLSTYSAKDIKINQWNSTALTTITYEASFGTNNAKKTTIAPQT